jgi:hypothetical protein
LYNDRISKPRQPSDFDESEKGGTCFFPGNPSLSLKLMQMSASAISSQASRVAELDERKLRLEEARIEREGEIEMRRIKVEEDREAPLQCNEERQTQMEELRIASQKAQTELMLKMLEIF